MKIIATFNKRVINENNNSEITLEVSNLASQELIKSLEKDKVYRITLEEQKSKRTLEQNKIMWLILHEIAVARGGERANDDWEIYLEALERAGAKYEYIAVLPEGVELIKSQFRAVKELNTFMQGGKEFQVLKVYYGSSKMNTKEMNLLLETVKDMAIESGVEDFWTNDIL